MHYSKGKHYKIWMDKELKALKGNFEELKADAEATLENNYQEKVKMKYVP